MKFAQGSITAVVRSLNARRADDDNDGGHYVKDLKKIALYADSSGNSFYKYFIFRTDVRQLYFALAALHAQSADYILTFPAEYNEISRLDLIALAGAKDLNGLMRAVKDTPYEEAMRDALTEYARTNSVLIAQTVLEKAADVKFTEYAGGAKGRAGAGTEPSKKFRQSELYALRATESDLALIRYFSRLTRFSIPDSERAALGDPAFTLLPEPRLRLLTRLRTTEDLPEILSGTPYSALDPADVEGSASGILRNKLNKTLTWSVDPDELVFAYLSRRSI